MWAASWMGFGRFPVQDSSSFNYLGKQFVYICTGELQLIKWRWRIRGSVCYPYL
ncbi:hypothetical protein RchiOBHm_Chr2g0109371 [Rosa chinensis]|uniref:Uncharacterized protein n=1 Tax=Rosa chinensis TaxID=74649 RepID=A0A2P6RPF3_ROSCH|nr:hypothetical protein RchiOBHm_Chr2g0109371 [Rosa chinensis]